MSQGLTPKQERFCQLMAMGATPSAAMREAGYSPKTVDARPTVLLQKPHIRKRITELKKKLAVVEREKLGYGMSLIEEQLIGVASSLGRALRVELDLMENSDSDSVRERAARTIIELSKGILVEAAARRSGYDTLIRELYRQVKERDRKTVDVEVVDAEDH